MFRLSESHGGIISHHTSRLRFETKHHVEVQKLNRDMEEVRVSSGNMVI